MKLKHSYFTDTVQAGNLVDLIIADGRIPLYIYIYIYFP